MLCMLQIKGNYYISDSRTGIGNNMTYLDELCKEGNTSGSLTILRNQDDVNKLYEQFDCKYF